MVFRSLIRNFAAIMVRFMAIGSGSCGNSYLLMTNNDNLMIDAGIGIRAVKKCFSSNHMKITSLQRILITHDHADHVKGAGYVAVEAECPVYATQKVHRGIYENYSVAKKIPMDSQISIEKEQPVTLGDFTITPFHVPHDSPSYDNTGYKIEVEGIVFSIVTDCGHITDRIAEVISESDYLVLEADYDEEKLSNNYHYNHTRVNFKTIVDGELKMQTKTLADRVSCDTGHLSNRQCAEALAQNASDKLKHVWLCHLSEENNSKECAHNAVSQILESNGKTVGTDFNLTVLDRKEPSEIFELR